MLHHNIWNLDLKSIFEIEIHISTGISYSDATKNVFEKILQLPTLKENVNEKWKTVF